MSFDPDDPDWYAAVAAHLSRPRRAERRAAELRAGLLSRVHRSALAHREYQTVRVENGAWEPVQHGVSRRILRSDACVRVEIQRLMAGATLPWPIDVDAQELLVVDGRLACAAHGQPLIGIQGARSYCVRERVAAPEALDPLVAAEDTTIYVRQRLSDRAALPSLESRWWDMPSLATGWIDPGRRRWHGTSPGVEVLPLRGDSEVVSMLVRFAPNASVSDHGHALDEDCLVLQGEMFLGDILLRAGDYQLAPAGGGHFGETSDVGVVFFFHGALDPVLRGRSAGA